MNDDGKAAMNEDSVPTITSRAEFAAAVKWGLQAAAAQGARQIVFCDADFAVWPLDDQHLIDGLGRWLRQPQRRLVLLASSFDDVPLRCPRFNAWRRDWAHAIASFQAPSDLQGKLPSLLLADKGVSVQLIDAVYWRGRASLDRRRASQWSEEIDVVLQRSEAAFGVQTLGL